MKKPVIDYGKVRFSNICSPQFRHLFLILGWPAYLTAYNLTEKYITAENCYLVHSALDDIIPFCEIFVIPYVLWYGLIAASLLYFLFYSVESFKKLQSYIIIVQAIATVIFILFPTMQDLRPEVLPRDNFLCDVVLWLYNTDNNMGVCPSLHVAVSIAIASCWVKDKTANKAVKTFIVAFCVAVCLATVFIKQHSIVDSYVALPVCLVAEVLLFGKSYWLPKFKRLKKS